MTENEEIVILSKIEVDSITMKLDELISERDTLLVTEDTKVNANKITIINDYQTKIDELQKQKEQVIANYKKLLQTYLV
jgi:hypothetical protein